MRRRAKAREGGGVMLKHMHTLNEFVHYLVKSGVSDPAEVSPLHLAPSRM